MIVIMGELVLFQALFFWDSFVLILGIFFLVVLGGGGGWWIFFGGGGLYLWVVVAGCAVYGGVLLKVLSFFFLSFVKVFGFGICWRIR